jgi:hypothetical protein
MVDLENAILRAHKGFQLWTRERMQELVTCITGRIPGARSDWDSANESWAVISRPNQGIAYICAKIPFIVVADPFAKGVNECVKAEEAVVFEVSDFDDHRYKVTKSVLENIFAKTLTPVVSYDTLSIRDLWYATVS